MRFNEAYPHLPLATRMIDLPHFSPLVLARVYTHTYRLLTPTCNRRHCRDIEAAHALIIALGYSLPACSSSSTPLFFSRLSTLARARSFIFDLFFTAPFFSSLILFFFFFTKERESYAPKVGEASYYYSSDES